MISDVLWDCVVMDNGFFVDMILFNCLLYKVNCRGYVWKFILFKIVNWLIFLFLSYEDIMNRVYGYLNNISLFYICILL